MTQRNKLYTVNRFNRGMLSGRIRQNMFYGGGQTGTGLLNPNISAQEFWSRMGVNSQLNNPLGNQAASNQFLTNYGGKSDAISNPWSFKQSFSSDGLKAGLNAGANAALTAGADVVGGMVGNTIGDGLHSGAGDTIGMVGNTIGSAISAVNPVVGAAVKLGTAVFGGLTNMAFGTAVDEAKLQAAKSGTSQLNNFVSNASSFDAIEGPQAIAKVQDAYRGGWFSSSEARRKNEELKRARKEAELWARRGVENNVFNLQNNQINDLLANYASYGGPLTTLGIMQQNRYFDTIDKRSEAIAGKGQSMQPNVFSAKTFADGGLKAAFMDEFSKDPIAAAVRYNHGLEALAAQEEAKQIEAAKEQEYADMQKRLLTLETENQGLQALMAAQTQNPLSNIPDIPETTETPASSPIPSRAAYNSNWDYIEDQLRRSGKFNDIQIEGIKYNLQRESSIDPTAVGDGGQAIGLGQWHGKRQPKDRSLEGQTQHLIDTLSNFDGKEHWIKESDYRGFLNARTPEEAHYYIAKGYERPLASIVAKVKRDSDMSLKRLSAFGGDLTPGEKLARGWYDGTIGGFVGMGKALVKEAKKLTSKEKDSKKENFVGSGATARWKPSYKPKDASNFNAAFDEARNAGAETFIFGDKVYSTLKEANPIREFNNRYVGAGRTEDLIRERGNYGKDYGPLTGKYSLLPFIPYAFGGELGTNGTDFTNGLLYIDEGNTHEKNPLGGVPMGLDPLGIPNLVEEGETIYNDYVFSDRMKVPFFMYKELGLGGIMKKKGKEMSFADASKKLAQESEQRPNDPISRDGLEASLAKLAEVQEAERMRKQGKEYMGLEGYACGGRIGNKYSGTDSNNPWGSILEKVKFDPERARKELEEVMGKREAEPVITDVIRQAAAMQDYNPDMGLESIALQYPSLQQGEYNPYPTWMRKLPAYVNSAMAISDMLGLTNRGDYSGVGRLEAAARAAGYAPNIQYEGIGDYMKYVPLDRQSRFNNLLASARATDRALANTSSPSKAANILANSYATITGLGNVSRADEEYNRGVYERTKEFNRKTNMFNKQMGLEADMANARYYQAAKQMGLSGLAQAEALRDSIDARIGAARSANLTNALNSWSDIGRENFAFNMINDDDAYAYGIDKYGRTPFKRTARGKKGNRWSNG